MIAVRGLAKRFGYRWVLRNLDLDAAPGEILALLGPNGAGKTTLLRIMAGLAKPSLGQVSVAGARLPGEAQAARARLGLVGHRPMLYGDLSAADNLNFFAQLYAVESGRVGELLELVGLAGLGRQAVRSFSRGMQQRLTLARALLHRPRVLLLDEPHSSLDQEAAALLDRLLSDLAAEGCTILLASHDLARASLLATRIAVLTGGRIAADIPSADFQDDLAARYQAAVEAARA
jgi:heme exporter protein A